MSPTIAVCPHCGCVAASAKPTCFQCGRPNTPSLVAPRSAEYCWVSAGCSFACRVCGKRAPLDHLDTDGSVYCAQCGVEQAFPVESWTDALVHAHNVGDLSGPQPELGAVNPYESLGSGNSFAELREQSLDIFGGEVSRQTLHLRAAVGQPLCRACHVPLKWSTDRAQLTATCETCGEVAVYQVPSNSGYARLAGVIADGNRVGAVDARSEATTAGVVALLCPSCNAPLANPGGAQMVTCTFCKTVARIAPRMWRQLQPANAEPRPFWLLFGNPSRMRETLQIEASQREKKARYEAEEKQAREQKIDDEHAAKQRAYEARVREIKRQRRVLRMVLPLAVLGAIGAVVALTGPSHERPTRVAKKNAMPRPREVALADTERVAGCSCRRKSATLPTWLRMGAQHHWIGAFFESENETPVRLPLAANNAPPPNGDTLSFAIACVDGYDMIIIAGARATSYQLETGRMLWRTDLPAPLPQVASASPFNCRVLPVNRNLVEFDVPDREKVQFNAGNGTVYQGSLQR